MGRYSEAWTVNRAQSKSLVKPLNTFSIHWLLTFSKPIRLFCIDVLVLSKKNKMFF